MSQEGRSRTLPTLAGRKDHFHWQTTKRSAVAAFKKIVPDNNPDNSSYERFEELFTGYDPAQIISKTLPCLGTFLLPSSDQMFCIVSKLTPKNTL